jgi:tetratricopeptide (TPR) repeat protein
VRRARDSEPLSPVVNMYLGVAQTHAGQYDLALRQLNQTIELDPHNYRTFMFLGRTLSAINRQDDAIAAYERAIALNPEGLEAMAMMGASMGAKGDRSGALKAVERVVAAESRTSPAVLVAIIYARLGDAQQMFDWLSKAVVQKSTPIYLPLITEDFRPYLSDPRFHSFLDSIGLSHLAKH